MMKARKLLAVITSLVLVIGLLPTSAFARVSQGDGELAAGTLASSAELAAASAGKSIVQVDFYKHDLSYKVAVDSEGGMWVWLVSAPYDVPVKVLDDVKQVYNSGDGFMNVLKKDGSAWTWAPGSNSDTIPEPEPIVGLGSGVVDISGGAAVKADGTLWVWGVDAPQLANSEGAGSSTGPIQVKGIDHVTDVEAGRGNIYAITEGGDLYGWGSNASGQLAMEQSVEWVAAPTKLLDGVRSVSADSGTVAVVKNDKSLWMWGSNYNGTVGNGAVINYSLTREHVESDNVRTPCQVLADVKSVSCSFSCTAAVKTDGTLWVWGEKVLMPSVVDPDQTDSFPEAERFTTKPKQDFGAPHDVEQVSCAGEFGLGVIDGDGSLWVSRYNYGLGDGYTGDFASVSFSGLSPAIYSYERIFTDGNWYQVPDASACGSWGTCRWAIENRALTVYPGTGQSTIVYNADHSRSRSAYVPWCRYIWDITSVSFREENGKKVVLPEVCDGLFLLAGIRSAYYNDDYYKSSLVSVDLSGADSSGVKVMRNMFYRCTKLESLDLASFDMSNVTAERPYNTGITTSLDDMFTGCVALSTLKLGSKVKLSLADSQGSLHTALTYGPPTTSPYTGRWKRVEDGAAATYQQLCASDDFVGTWKWEETIDISAATVNVATATYTGALQQPKVNSVTLDSGSTVVPNGAYSVSCDADCVNAGTYTVTVKANAGSGYTGEATGRFVIEQAAITESMIADIPDQFFNGEAVTPSVAVSFGGATLSPESDYTVVYENNKSVGNATATVTAKATSVNFTGSASKSFKIVAEEIQPKSARDAWSFVNIGYNIDLHFYTDFYGDSFGREIYYKFPGNKGVCYGMSAAAFSSSLYGRPSVPSWTNGVNVAAQLYDVGKNWISAETSTWTKAGANLSALDYIKYAFIAQADPKMSMQYRSNMKTPGNRNMAELDELVQAINDALAGKRELPVLCIFPSMWEGGHAISPLRMGESTSNADEVVIYDCNHPGEERSLWLYKNGNGDYAGWQYDLGWGVWGTTVNSTARITWEWPSEALPSMFDRKGEFNKDKYEDALWHSRLYSSSANVTAVSDGKEYSLSPDTTADFDKVAYVPVVAYNPDVPEQDFTDLYWTNLADEVGFKDIGEDAEIGVASSTGGVNLKVAAGSEAIVKVSEDSSNKVDIKQNAGDSFEVEYFEDTGTVTDGELDTVKLSGVGDRFVYTQQVGSNVAVSGVTQLSVTNAEDNVVTMQLDAASTYTVIPSNDKDRPEIMEEGKKATKPVAKDFTYDGKQHVGVATGEGYTLSGVAKATKVGTYSATASLAEGWQWADGSKGDVKLTWRINPKKVAKPAANDFTYDGKQHVGVRSDEGYALSGTAKTSKPGTYKVTASLDEGYVWSDGKSADVKLTWRIKTGVANGKTAKVSGVAYKVKSNSDSTIMYQKAPKGKKAVTVPKTVVVAGKTYKVVGISKNAFKGAKAQTVTVKTAKLVKSRVKGCFAGSKVKTVKVKVGSASANKKTVSKYKKYFTKKNCGAKVTVK